MNNIKLLLKVAAALLKNPKSLIRVIDEESTFKDYLVKKFGHEHALPAIDLLELFPDFEEAVQPYSFLEGASPSVDLAVLKALARRYSPCRYLEIGSWRGESLANVASVAEACVSISLSEKEMRQAGLSEAFIKTHRVFSQSLKNVTHLGHNSQTFDFSSLGKKFDLIFIDGDHSYESVKIDTQNAFALLQDEQAVIVWHDYGFTPETVRWSVLAGILDGCPPEKRNHLYQVSNTLCAIYLNGKFKTSHTSFPQIPNKSFTVKISATKIN